MTVGDVDPSQFTARRGDPIADRAGLVDGQRRIDEDGIPATHD
jgi:hypothetical protein